MLYIYFYYCEEADTVSVWITWNKMLLLLLLLQTPLEWLITQRPPGATILTFYRWVILASSGYR